MFLNATLNDLLTVHASGLDIALMSPIHGSKFSPNLWKWLTLRHAAHHTWTSLVYCDQHADLWIGFPDDGYFVGARLVSVLCQGPRAGSACWTDLGPLTLQEHFWHDYLLKGRCAVDPSHNRLFLGDADRWETKDGMRQCRWCGEVTQVLRRWTESANCSTWANT